MAAFGLGKLPFFSSRRSDDDGDALFEETVPLAIEDATNQQPVAQEAVQPRELAPPVVAKREKQIDGQAIRRPVPGAAAMEGGFLSLAGIREHYMAEEPQKGLFVIRHTESGQEVTISGIDYIQFADLTVSCAFLTRSNSDDLVLPAPAQKANSEGSIHDLTKEVTTAINEGLLSDNVETAAAPEEPAAAPPAIEEIVGDVSAAESKAATSGAITITEAELLAGAGDEAGLLRIANIVCQQEGRLESHNNGSWTFHPAPSFSGEIALELTIHDANGEKSCVEAILTIEADDVRDSDQAPTAAGMIAADTPVADTIAEMAVETAESAAAPAMPPEAEIASPAEQAPRAQDVEPQVVEPSEAIHDGTMTPEAACQEAAPQSQAEDLIVKVSELIGEDFEGQNVRLHDFTQPDNGRLLDNGDGTLSFTPNPDWGGSTTFTYSVIDEAGKITSCTLLVELDPEDASESQMPIDEAAPLESAPIESAAVEMPSVDIPDVDVPAVDIPNADLMSADATAEAQDDTAETDLYDGARYEDIEVDEEDRPIGAGAAEMIALNQGVKGKTKKPAKASGASSPADILGSLKANAKDRPVESAAETPKKPKKRSKNAEAAEALFKQLDW